MFYYLEIFPLEAGCGASLSCPSFSCLDFYLLQIPIRLVDFAAEFFDLIVNVGAAAFCPAFGERASAS